jgi:hypothetical protein
MRRATLTALLALFPVGAAAAKPNALVSDGVVGAAYLTKARSHTISHLFKPIVRFDLRAEIVSRLEVGGGAVAILSSSEHYRVLGALGEARFALFQAPAFSLGGSAGLGLGYDADILHTDLKAGARIAPYWLVAVDGRWALGDRWLLGVEAGWQNAALLHLGAILGRRLGGGAR